MILPKPEPWMADAACAQVDPELWFPEKGGSSAAAKRICQSCPVLQQCLGYAVEHFELGVWGGTSDKQRKAMRAAREAA